MAREIFISYSRKDLNKVKTIKSAIEKATGVECWMDLEDIESGAAQFTQDIVDGINRCRIFLFMLSRNSQESTFALRELNFAMKKAGQDTKKHVVIINIDGCIMCDEFDFMYGLTDTIVWDQQPQKEKLMKDLKNWLRNREGEVIDDMDDNLLDELVAISHVTETGQSLYDPLDRTIEDYDNYRKIFEGKT